MRKLLASARSLKAIFAIAAAVLVLGTAVGGTIAWIVARSNPVQNTFTINYSEDEPLDITLTETDTGDGDGNANTNSYPMAPGADIPKDPTVTVYAYSMPCWLFVRVNESENLAAFIDYAVAEDWQPLPGSTNVYVRQVEQMNVNQAFPVLKDNMVHVKPEVTYEMLRALTAENYPVLTFEAFAVQRGGVATAQDAWQLATGEVLAAEAEAEPQPETEPAEPVVP